MIFLDKFFFWKNSINFWHPKLTLKVQFWHFLTNCHYLKEVFKDFSLVACWFLAKKLAFKDSPSLKFHIRTDINVGMHLFLYLTKSCNIFYHYFFQRLFRHPQCWKSWFGEPLVSIRSCWSLPYRKIIFDAPSNPL